MKIDFFIVVFCLTLTVNALSVCDSAVMTQKTAVCNTYSSESNCTLVAATLGCVWCNYDPSYICGGTRKVLQTCEYAPPNACYSDQTCSTKINGSTPGGIVRSFFNNSVCYTACMVSNSSFPVNPLLKCAPLPTSPVPTPVPAPIPVFIPASAPSSSTKKELSAGAILGILFGTFGAIGVLLLFILFVTSYCKKRIARQAVAERKERQRVAQSIRQQAEESRMGRQIQVSMYSNQPPKLQNKNVQPIERAHYDWRAEEEHRIRQREQEQQEQQEQHRQQQKREQQQRNQRRNDDDDDDRRRTNYTTYYAATSDPSPSYTYPSSDPTPTTYDTGGGGGGGGYDGGYGAAAAE